jgi:hypothetical protein
MQPGTRHPFYRDRLRSDTGLYTDLALCHEWGIPHSEFLEWEPEDRAKAIAFLFEKNSRCDLCGTAQWEWDNNKRAYSPVEEKCMGCYYKEIAGQDASDSAGVTVRMVPTDTQEYAQHLVEEQKRG